MNKESLLENFEKLKLRAGTALALLGTTALVAGCSLDQDSSETTVVKKTVVVKETEATASDTPAQAITGEVIRGSSLTVDDYESSLGYLPDALCAARPELGYSDPRCQ